MTLLLACPNPEDLRRLALGQLPEEEAAGLGRHVLDCSACAELLNSFHLTDPLAAENAATVTSARVDDSKPFKPKVVKYEIFGSASDANVKLNVA